MLETVTIDSFRPRQGETFRITTHDAIVDVVLTAVEQLRGDNSERSDRVPFSLVFHGPASSSLPQQIYQVENDALGAIELFLVPIGPDAAGMRYQAIFT